MNEPLSAPFRVIIVGGGVAGLTAAHALSKAHIDHIVLERGSDPAPPAGASIAIYPHGARILHQIGCLQAAKDSCVSMEGFVNRMPDGRAIVDSKFLEYIKEKYVSFLTSALLSYMRTRNLLLNRHQSWTRCTLA